MVVTRPRNRRRFVLRPCHAGRPSAPDEEHCAPTPPTVKVSVNHGTDNSTVSTRRSSAAAERRASPRYASAAPAWAEPVRRRRRRRDEHVRPPSACFRGTPARRRPHLELRGNHRAFAAARSPALFLRCRARHCGRFQVSGLPAIPSYRRLRDSRDSTGACRTPNPPSFAVAALPQWPTADSEDDPTSYSVVRRTVSADGGIRHAARPTSCRRSWRSPVVTMTTRGLAASRRDAVSPPASLADDDYDHRSGGSLPRLTT